MGWTCWHCTGWDHTSLKVTWAVTSLCTWRNIRDEGLEFKEKGKILFPPSSTNLATVLWGKNETGKVPVQNNLGSEQLISEGWSWPPCWDFVSVKIHWFSRDFRSLPTQTVLCEGFWCDRAGPSIPAGITQLGLLRSWAWLSSAHVAGVTLPLRLPQKSHSCSCVWGFQSATAQGAFCALQETILDRQGAGSLSFASLPSLRKVFPKPSVQLCPSSLLCKQAAFEICGLDFLPKLFYPPVEKPKQFPDSDSCWLIQSGRLRGVPVT